MDVLRALAAARAEADEERRQQAVSEAAACAEEQNRAKERAAQQRAGIVAGGSWTTQEVDPFDVLDLAPRREPGYHKGRKPTEPMKDCLRRAKVPFTEETSYWEAHLLIEEIVRRRTDGLCTFAQAKWLREHGYSGDITFEECQDIMEAWRRNDWMRPADDPASSPVAFMAAQLNAIAAARAPDDLTRIGKGLREYRQVLPAESWERLIAAGRARRRQLCGVADACEV